jgi:preprotein translocase subunit YajC
MWEMVLLMSNPNQGGKGGGGGLLGFLPFILIIVIFYFLLIRPQSKRQKTLQRMLESVKKGDEIVTTGGIHGKVLGVKEGKNLLIVEIDDNVKIELDRGSVGRIVSPGEGTTEDEKFGKIKP